MGKKLELVGQKFGRWAVISEAGRNKQGNFMWLCQCDCGERRIVSGGSLTSDNSRSCGCIKDEIFAERTMQRSFKHGHAKRGSASRTYISWESMISRCTNQNNREGFAKYGAKGVRVCTEWINSFESFLASLGERPEGTTLGRVLDMGNYEPDNCFWMTPAEQGLARRNKVALLKWTEQQTTQEVAA
jgi:hypothetical protein